MKEVLIIGSGAGGSSLALGLAEQGVKSLVLERGPRYERQDYGRDEVSTTRRDFFRPSPYAFPHALQHHGQNGSIRSDMGWTACCVGGGTVIMAAYLYRLHPDDFRLRERFGAFEDIADWPYSYEELEPYYSRAEWELGVSGNGGSNPFEGARSRPYPMPPVRSHRLAAVFDKACQSLNLNPFPTPRGINSQAYEDRPGCAYCPTCAGYGCGLGAKASAQETLLAKAERTGNCEVRPRSMVREITVDDQGRASGCIYLDAEGVEHEVRAKTVCVCCSAVESARLLLLSKSPRFPDGLGNGHGQVGRHVQFHCSTGGLGHFRDGRHPEQARGDSTPFLGRSVMDHYFLPPGVSDLPKGGTFRFGLQENGPIAAAQRVVEEGPQRLWGEALKKAIQGYSGRDPAVDFEVFHDFVPNHRTYVDLDGEHSDASGLPVARIHLDSHQHHQKAGAWLLDRCREILHEMGIDQATSTFVGQPAHILVVGTCRAGQDPKTSVVDSFCRSHEVPNLFVVDGSFMPTTGGVPPTLTIAANGLRTADSMIALARKGELH